MANPSDDSLGSGATRVGGNKPDDRYQVSLGDQSTFGGGPGHDDTILESDMEIVDLASRYTIEGPLGKGGMGEVLLAIDTRLKRKVAIKRVRADKALSPIALSRFLTEAQSVASLNHFNIVQVYDYGRDKDGPFLIMEYVDGSSLLDRCKSGPMPLEEAIDITCQLCDGLGRAHELGIIHRDIKPANVLMTQDGKPKLTDFGLAKQDTADHGQTMAGSVIGTLDFMPPEQRRDVSLTDARSDLWSLAATFYQMISGKSPKIIRFDLLPPSLTIVLGKALEENKADRYQSASEFRDALLSCITQTAPLQLPDADLGTGECPSCHTKNESHRKYCRECAISLRVDCLSCKVEIPVWDKVCPECGKKQAELVAARRTEMEAKRLQAEHECNQCEFHEATRIAKKIASETDSRLQHLKTWVDAFLLKVSEEQARYEEEQARQKEFAKKQFADALTHRQSFDYPSAIHALAAIPEVLRSREMSQLLDKFHEEQKESISLVELITERIDKRELAGLQKLIDRALELRGNDEVLRRLKLQFKNLLVTRDKVVAEASAKLNSLDYPGCIAALQAIDPRLETPQVVELRKTAEQKNKRVLQLRKEIHQAVDGKRDDLPLKLVEELIPLVGKDDQLQKLRDQLLKRDKSLQVEIDKLVRQADELRTKCQFLRAAEYLGKIPENRKSGRYQSLINELLSLASLRDFAISALKRAIAEENYDHGINKSREYDSALQKLRMEKLLKQGKKNPTSQQILAIKRREIEEALEPPEITDLEFEKLRNRCKQGVVKRKAVVEAAKIAERQKASFRENAMISAIVVGVILLIFGIGVYWNVSSKYRAKAIADGIAAQKWEDVLKLDAKNVPALLGRAGVKINQGEPDFEDALKTLATDALSKLPAEVISKFPPLVNSIGMSLKLIPAGTFKMGFMGFDDEYHDRLRDVTLTRPYYLGVYEVTQEEYQRVMGTNPSKFQGARNPVEQVSWDEAVSFCKKLSELPEEKSAGRVYRLPSEAEWCYARPMETREYFAYFGISDSQLAENAWYSENSGGSTHPVGEKKPNAWGLHDMHGNVGEWCRDWREYKPNGPVTDPQGPNEGHERVVRGMCYSNYHYYCTSLSSDDRDAFFPNKRWDFIGFRVAMDSPVE